MIPGMQGIGKIPELRKRIFFTLGMLAVYRFGIFVSTPGIDVEALRRQFDTSAGSLFGLVNMFSGGALKQFSIFTLGIMPYISVSIIMQLLSSSIPALEALKKEGEAGQRVITRYTRQGTVALALFQGFMVSLGLESQGLVLNPGWSFRITTMITLTAGTAFIMWLGEQISEKGIGNGMSIVIFAGIVARMPATFISTLVLARSQEVAPISVLIVIVFCILTVAGIVFVERSHRKIPIQYPRRMVGRKMSQAQTQYMPLKVNMSGVIPPIFASAFLMLPATVATVSSNETLQEMMSYLVPGSWVYSAIFAGLIVFFSFFYTALIFNPPEVAENLKKNGGFVPTVRPGKATADFFYGVLNRLTLWGAIYIALVCLVPQFVYFKLGLTSFAYIFGGTAVLIAVGVILDTVSQIESYIVARNYEDFMSKSHRQRGGLGSMRYTRNRLLRR
ncbi:MAG: preprotein translocase subunit SecY [Candidatus Dadabacteria bacterium]|nr:MAG: preprotein translocase subunit SecY [Candidatus Dadabacteria bacterium]